MARTIDPNKLDDQDILYLKDRMWMVQEFERQGFGEQMAKVRELDQPIPGVSYEDRHTVEPTWHDKITTTEMSQGFGEPDLMDPDSEPIVDDNYEEWTVEELKADIDARNQEEGRKTKLSKAGSKEDLAKRLHEDDAAED